MKKDSAGFPTLSKVAIRFPTKKPTETHPSPDALLSIDPNLAICLLNRKGRFMIH